MSEHFLHELILVSGILFGLCILLKNRIRLSRFGFLAVVAVLILLFSEIGLGGHLFLHGHDHQIADGYHSCCLPVVTDAVAVAEFKPVAFLTVNEKLFSVVNVITIVDYNFQNKSPPLV